MQQLPTQFQQYIFTSKYAKWLPEEGRRETWPETVTRYVDFMAGHIAQKHGYVIDDTLALELHDAILNLEIMPSMRCLMTAGKALQLENVAGFNCAYAAVDDTRVFDEAMYILMCGTGVGFSVETQHVEKLPTIPTTLLPSGTVIKVGDSREGWATALRQLIEGLYEGKVHGWDVSAVRAAGKPLKTFGGRASGPEPLVRVFEQAIAIFKKANGRKLTALECHDLMCHIARAVIVGGVRRSAMISLSDLGDDTMRLAKCGAWWEINPDRAYANNSAVYNTTPTMAQFMHEWESLYLSRSGERGIFNREAVLAHIKRLGRAQDVAYGTNPCSEIILKPNSFCNLTEVIVADDDRVADLKRKVRLATILGTFQSTLTHYPYIRKVWQENAEGERLLGVSMTGIMGNALLSPDKWGLYAKTMGISLEVLRAEARITNKKWSKLLGITESHAITCVKPSGTVSALTGVSSGIHPWHAPYYIRRVRQDAKDPLTKLMQEAGVPWEKAAMGDAIVFAFPMKAPSGAICAKDISAIGQLEHWLAFQRHYTEHKPSITVSVREDEWMDVGAWVYKHFDEMTGVSFLPMTDHVYVQAPFTEVTKEEYDIALAAMPEIDWSKLSKYEKKDMTTGSHELACSGSSCEVF